MKRTAALGIALAALCVAPARAADEGQVLRQQAERLASQDRCGEAVELARRARALDPSDARAARVEGRCLVRGLDYEAALAPLREARELDPSLPGLSTDLVQCHYHLDQLDEARAEAQRALAENPDDARLQLYIGLLRSREAREAEAAAAFDRAASLDSSLVEAASLYSGRTWAGLRDREQARQALVRARDADPDSEWGQAAAQELERLDEPYRRRGWVRFEGGIEYDSNVPRVEVSPNLISRRLLGPFPDDEEDWRTLFEADAGVELSRSPDRSVGVAVGYAGNAHFDLHDFDLMAPWASLWLDQRLGEDTWLRVQPSGGYIWFDSEPFAAYGGATLSVSTLFSDDTGGRAFVDTNYVDIRLPIRVPASFTPAQNRVTTRARNRDGLDLEAGLELHHTFDASDTRLRFGSAYERTQTEGRDWSFHGGEVWLGLLQPLPRDLRFELEGRYTYRDFDHRSSYLAPRVYFGTGPGGIPPAPPFSGGGPDRRDQLFEVEAELSHRVTDWLELAVHYRFQDQESNTSLFDYDSHVAGATFTLYYGDF